MSVYEVVFDLESKEQQLAKFEEKICESDFWSQPQEAQKILGRLDKGRVIPASFPVSAQCTRVPVFDGHLETVSVKLAHKTSVDELKAVYREFKGYPQENKLPSAPENPILVFEEENRPQPARDVWKNGGMSACVGRIRECAILDYKMVILGHNTIRGAAGASILNAETFVSLGYLDS